MKINSGDQNLVEQIKKLDRERLDHVANKEAEINNIKKYYDKKVESTKTEGENKHLNAIDKNNQLILDSATDLETKIKNYQDNLDRTKKNIEKEQLALSSAHIEKKDALKTQFEEQIQDQYANTQDIQINTHQKLQSEIKNLDTKTRQEKNLIEQNASYQVNALANEYNQQGAQNEREFRTKLQDDLRMHANDIAAQKTELTKSMAQAKEKNSRMQSEKIRINNDELTYLDAHQQDMIKQKQNDFKIRIDNITKEHENIITNLKAKLDSDMKKLISDESRTKENISNRMADSFYKIETLSPKLIEGEKDVQVMLSVPEHEKENVHLSAHGRGIKMTLSRKFSDETIDTEGVNRSTKTQLYSKELKTNDILNPKTITQKYENGILSFKIAKL